MTICVAGPGHVVTDSLDGCVPPCYSDKAWRMHGYIIAMCGTSSGSDQLLETQPALWPKKPSTESLVHYVNDVWPGEAGAETTWMVVTRAQVWTIEGGYVYQRAFPYAIGSGAPWALGRLSAAPDELSKAVAVAIRCEPSCGGRVRELKLP